MPANLRPAVSGKNSANNRLKTAPTMPNIIALKKIAEERGDHWDQIRHGAADQASGGEGDRGASRAQFDRKQFGIPRPEDADRTLSQTPQSVTPEQWPA